MEPNAATTWQWLGETLDGIGRYGSRATALQPGGRAPVIIVASLHAVLGETGEALDALDEGIRRNEPLGTLIRWWPPLGFVASLASTRCSSN